MAETQRIENIDERILRILGLENEPYVESDDYIRALREKMAAGRMSSSSMSSEETELVTNEFKRVRNKGKFKVKKKATINAKNIGGSKIISGQMKPVPKMLTGSFVGVNPGRAGASTQEQPGEQNKEEINYLSIIDKSLKSILASLKTLAKTQVKGLEDARLRRESQARKSKEDILEKPTNKDNKKILDLVPKPVSNFIEKIFGFLFKALLARAFMHVMRWLSDEENQKKLNNVIRFLSNFWPILVALYLRFGTTLGKLVGKLSKFLIKGALMLIKTVLPRILNFIAANPLAAGALAVGGTAAAATFGAEMFRQKEEKNQIKREAGDRGVDPSQVKKELDQSKKGIGSLFGDAFSSIGPIGYEKGGKVPGSGNKDTVAAMLTPGEFVMSKGAVQRYGVDTLASMNAAGGGNNRPKSFGGVTFANGGGYIGEENEKSDSRHKMLMEKRARENKKQIKLENIVNTQIIKQPAIPSVNKEKSLQQMGYSQAEIQKYIAEENYVGKTGTLPTTPIIPKTTINQKNIASTTNNNIKLPQVTQTTTNNNIKLPQVTQTTTNNIKLPQVIQKKRNSILDDLMELRQMRAGSLERQGRTVESMGVRGMNLMGLSKIFENSGKDLKGKTDDRQLISVQPGEQIFNYVMPKDAVDKGAGNVLLSFANALSSTFDSNSNAAKMGVKQFDSSIAAKIGKKDLTFPEIKPYSAGGMMNLPPIALNQNNDNSPVNPSSASEITDFSAISSDSPEYREAKRQILGII